MTNSPKAIDILPTEKVINIHDKNINIIGSQTTCFYDIEIL
jgi:hypothetical protein